jgi:hypothetical protein
MTAAVEAASIVAPASAPAMAPAAEVAGVSISRAPRTSSAGGLALTGRSLGLGVIGLALIIVGAIVMWSRRTALASH